MIWTTDKPTKTGWYWWREYETPLLVFVSWHGPSTPYLLGTVHGPDTIIFCAQLTDAVFKGEWAGPLEPPKEAK